jgi:hypothetical protein
LETPPVAGIALLALVLAGCGDDSLMKPRAQPASPPPCPTDGRFLVVNQDDRRVLAYLCDGKNVATWLKGQAARDGTVTLAGGDGALVNGRIDANELTGTVTLPGETSARPLVASAVPRRGSPLRRQPSRAQQTGLTHRDGDGLFEPPARLGAGACRSVPARVTPLGQPPKGARP